MNSKRVLLLRPNSTDGHKDSYVAFPLGLGYIASSLRDVGHQVSVIDLTIEEVDEDLLRRRVKVFSPDMVGITALSYAYDPVKKLAALIKSVVKCPIVLGGQLSTYSSHVVLRNTAVDICVIGEGELTSIELMKHLDDPSKVLGVSFIRNGEQVFTPSRPVIEDLDSISMPAYDLFPMDEYTKMNDVYLSRQHTAKGKVHRKLCIEAGRGCPFGCHFCSTTFKRVRKRSVGSLVAEMRYLHYVYGVDTFGFQDELFFSSKSYVREFCSNISDMQIGWFGNARVDTVDEETILLARDNKCLEIAFGVESGSQSILDAMNKKTKVDRIEHIISFAIDSNMPIDMGLILGYPGENEKSVQDTIDMLSRIGYPGLKFRYLTPYPGSKVYDAFVKSGFITDEDRYLTSLGDGRGPYVPRFNLTEFDDDALRRLLKVVSDKVFMNYIIYLLLRPWKLMRRIFRKDVMNPLYVIVNRIQHPTNYDKARKMGEDK